MKFWVVIRQAMILLVLAAKRGWLAAKVFVRGLSAGSKPNQAVRTAVAAYVGIARLPR